ncbi:hotdog fold thioesterase [Lysinibacillus sp. NPDC095746]|uniref:hotdog fold thioesterase n=1 Tax=Lysinibacillus sp. NPDC095746 TaxID=3364134 RepID=UPI0038070C14
MELVELKAGFAKMTIFPTPHMLNTHGTVHGGIIFSLADYAFAAASNSYGKTAVGVTNTIHYMSPALADHQLTAIAEEVKFSLVSDPYLMMTYAQQWRRWFIVKMKISSNKRKM